MSYLRIKNEGVAPVESFTTLGLSTSADSKVSGVIGQFGSGTKHAINLLLRNGLDLVIFAGATRIVFGSRTRTVHAPDGSKTYEQATINVDGVVADLGYTVDFGKSDWHGVGMALREFVSNALDMTNKLHGSYQHDTLAIETVDDIVPIEGATSVYVQSNDETREYVRSLHKHFLHFAGKPLEYGPVLRVDGLIRPARIYREGVLIREIDDSDSIFDYNFQADEIEIDECRNLDNVRAKSMVETKLTYLKSEHVEIIVTYLKKNRVDLIEVAGLGRSWHLENYSRDTWEKALASGVGENEVFCVDNEAIVKQVRSEGKLPVIVADNLIDTLAKQGATTYKTVLSTSQQKGQSTREGEVSERRYETRVWRALRRINAIRDDVKRPEVIYYQEEEGRDGQKRFGYVENGQVFINEEISGQSELLASTLIEEFCHYATGHGDYTRGLQSWAFTSLAKALKLTDTSVTR